MSELFVFAVNGTLTVTHTDLTRQKGETPVLPPLATWLGTEVDTDRIELFAVADLAPMTLADYLATAYDISADASERERLNKTDGHVLLVPSDAVSDIIEVGADLSHIASLETPRADHSSRDLTSPADEHIEPTTAPKPPMSEARISGMVAMGALVVLALLTLLFVLLG